MDIKCKNIALIVRYLFATVIIVLLSTSQLYAAVTGACPNCHIMHNSQDGSALIGQVNDTLLVSDCVGCHSSAGTETIVNLGSARVPIVFNTTGYPDKPLAGGNFYDVAKAGGNLDSHGHNVYGISDEDATLNHAPKDSWGAGCTNTCHNTLALPKSSMMAGTNFDGCQSCHQKFKHHGSTVADGALETAGSGWYRFLGGHDPRYGGPDEWPTAYVKGVEDADWEHDPDTGHNRYYEVLKAPSGYAFLQNTQSMSNFCLGCHYGVHQNYWDTASSAWLRHPTMIRLPNSGEYAAYNPVTDYDATVAVGWLDPTTPVRGDAVVMCLSCHRAHGSEHPDMLRWDPNNVVAGGGESDEGCFKCHSSKDT